MFLIRASLLVMMAFVSMTRCEGVGEDRIGTLLSMMVDMRKDVGSLTESVKKVYRMEEETAEHVSKTEDRVEEIVQNEEDTAKKVGKLVQGEEEIEKKVGNIDSQIAHMKTQMGQLEKKVDNVDTDVVTSWMIQWKLIGYGYQGSCGRQVSKDHTTLQECATFCTKKRQDSGTAWNGFNWDQGGDQHCTCNENDVGHYEDAGYLHFKIQ